MVRGSVVGLDVSTDRTGAAWGRGAGRPTAAVWRMGRPDEPLWVRHGALARLVGDLLARERPELVVIEEPLDPFAMRGKTNLKTITALIGAACVAAATAHLCGVPRIELVRVDAIRKAFIGQGKVRKGMDADGRMRTGGELAKRAVMERCRVLGWAAADHNASDALAAWSWGVGQLSPIAAMMTTPLLGRRA